LAHDSLEGKHVVIIGKSNLVGKPLGLLLLNEGATVTYVHRQTKNPQDLCRQADILVVAAGQAGLVTADWVKPGATVIDVGINTIMTPEGRRLVGDVDFQGVSQVAAYITPVPVGVGPMTVACLLSNTVDAFLSRHFPSSQ
jgi:methylenetetrahydrofolate dehydrogenase (NADP+)/methenyltetrahydrofolate cyclohydrolase